MKRIKITDHKIKMIRGKDKNSKREGQRTEGRMKGRKEGRKQ